MSDNERPIEPGDSRIPERLANVDRPGRRIFPEMFTASYQEHLDCYVLIDQGGLVPTSEEFELVVEMLRTAYSVLDDSDIRQHNVQKLEGATGEERRAAAARTAPRRRKQAGYVYLIEGGGYYKIGKAKNPSNRAQTLAIHLPYPTRLLHAIKSDDSDRAEKHLHERYADRRTNGEWFDLDGDEVREIMGIASLFEENA